MGRGVVSQTRKTAIKYYCITPEIFLPELASPAFAGSEICVVVRDGDPFSFKGQAMFSLEIPAVLLLQYLCHARKVSTVHTFEFESLSLSLSPNSMIVARMRQMGGFFSGYY